MYTDKDFHAIKEIVIKNVPDAVCLILFGSYARGDANEESDMDFLILTEGSIERKDKLERLSNTRWQVTQAGYKSDFLLKSEADFLKARNKPTLSSAIAEEGRIIWRKN